MIALALIACLGWCAASAFGALWYVERMRYQQLIAQPIMIPAGEGRKGVRPTIGSANGLPALQTAEVIQPGLDAEARVLRAVSAQTKTRTVEGLLDMAKRMGKELSEADAQKQAELLLAIDAGQDS